MLIGRNPSYGGYAILLTQSKSWFMSHAQLILKPAWPCRCRLLLFVKDYTCPWPWPCDLITPWSLHMIRLCNIWDGARQCLHHSPSSSRHSMQSATKRKLKTFKIQLQHLNVNCRLLQSNMLKYHGGEFLMLPHADIVSPPTIRLIITPTAWLELLWDLLGERWVYGALCKLYRRPCNITWY